MILVYVEKGAARLLTFLPPGKLLILITATRLLLIPLSVARGAILPKRLLRSPFLPPRC
jgi:hypothetical protein